MFHLDSVLAEVFCLGLLGGVTGGGAPQNDSPAR